MQVLKKNNMEGPRMKKKKKSHPKPRPHSFLPRVLLSRESILAFCFVSFAYEKM